MKVIRLVLLLTTFPLLFLVPYFLFSGNGEAERPQDKQSILNLANKSPRTSSSVKTNIVKKKKNDQKNLVISEHRFKRKEFLKVDQITKIENSINYLFYAPPQPWPKGLEFPLIVHISDRNDSAYSAEYITQQKLSLAFPAFSIVPDTSHLYGALHTSLRSGSNTRPMFTSQEKNNKTSTYKSLRKHSLTFLLPLKKLIENVTDSYPVDKNRIYLIGCGYGATALFHLIENNPDSFASSVLISSAWQTDDYRKFKNTPLLIMTGKKNIKFPSFVAQSFAKNVQKVGGNVRYQAFESMPHVCSFKEFYSNKVWTWMFSHKQK